MSDTAHQHTCRHREDQEPEENQRREDVSLRVSQTQICFYIVGGDAYQIHKSHSEKAEHHRDQLG